MAVCILEKLCFSCRPSPLPCRFPRMCMILFAILYIIYKLLQFVSFMLFLQRRRFLAILFAFFVYFYVLSNISENFFVQNKTRNTKRRFFLFFSSVVRKFLSISLFPLCPLFFVTALSPAPPEKPRTDFLLRSIFLSTVQNKTLISLSALPAAACVLRVFSAELRVLFLQNQQKRTLSTAEYFSFFVGRKLFFRRNFSLNSTEENSQSTYYI